MLIVIAAPIFIAAIVVFGVLPRLSRKPEESP